MLSSREVQILIEKGMVEWEPIPEALRTPELESALREDWQKQFEIEGGYLDLTISEMRFLVGDIIPDISPCGRVEPKTRPVRWLTNEPIPYYRLMPEDYLLFTTRETFRIPPDITVRLDHKSTMQRCGLDVICSPAHASYNGRLTLGLKVIGPLPVDIRYGARLLTSSFYRVNAEQTTQYSGPHQGGVITTEGKTIASY